MANFKEFQLDGCISVPEAMDEDTFIDKFLELIEDMGWLYGGGLNGYKEGNDNG